MSKPKPLKLYTATMYREFDRLTADACSRDQMARISGRLALNRFIAKHGKEICDAMYEEIKRRDSLK